MNVTLATHGHSVAQLLRHRLDRSDNVPLRLSNSLERFHLAQRRGRENRPIPSPEILRRKIGPADLAKIIIHIAGPDRLSFAFIVEKLKQLVSRKIEKTFHDTR